MNENKANKNTDHDGGWKSIISELHEEFISFYLPEIHSLIDFSEEVISLEQEFQKIDKTGENSGKSYNDKLFRVKLLDGNDHFILIHVEVQSSRDPDFLERMFRYFYRIRDKYGNDVTAIAVYTNNDVPKIYDRYEYSFHGTKICYEFNAYKIKDVPKAVLHASKNPFALASLAAQYLNETMNDAEKRLVFKKMLGALALERGYTVKQAGKLLLFIKNMLKLPKGSDEELEFKEYINQKLYKMPINLENKDFVDSIFETVYGESIQDFVSKETAEMQAEMAEKMQAKTIEMQAKTAEMQAEKAEIQAEKAEITEKMQAEKLSAARKLLSKGISMGDVAEAFNMTLEEIKEIKASL